MALSGGINKHEAESVAHHSLLGSTSETQTVGGTSYSLSRYAHELLFSFEENNKKNPVILQKKAIITFENHLKCANT